MAKKYAFTRGRYQRDTETGEFTRIRKQVAPRSKVYRVANPPKKKGFVKYSVRTPEGKKRNALLDRPSSKVQAQLKLGKVFKSGQFDKLPKTDKAGSMMKKSVLGMAKKVGLSAKEQYKIKRMNKDKLFALMTYEDMMINIVFDYGGVEYDNGEMNSNEGIENLEFLISRYEKMFGAIR